jgi:hypothetical protein
MPTSCLQLCCCVVRVCVVCVYASSDSGYCTTWKDGLPCCGWVSVPRSKHRLCRLQTNPMNSPALGMDVRPQKCYGRTFQFPLYACVYAPVILFVSAVKPMTCADAHLCRSFRAIVSCRYRRAHRALLRALCAPISTVPTATSTTLQYDADTVAEAEAHLRWLQRRAVVPLHASLYEPVMAAILGLAGNATEVHVLAHLFFSCVLFFCVFFSPPRKKRSVGHA